MNPERLQIRVHGSPNQPVLIYLPGLHGDWTLVGSFRAALAGRVRFIEFTYPRTTSWSLADYGAQVEAALIQQGITCGWLLGESFGSQVAWAVEALPKPQFHANGWRLPSGEDHDSEEAELCASHDCARQAVEQGRGHILHSRRRT
jgi:hypothetical protein